MLTRPITRGITRPITRPLVRQSSAFDPLTLWAQGQQGAWYDPSDLSTLFQDAAGTTPVTSDGDPVGLMLDKSQGLELGHEEIDLSAGSVVTSGDAVGSYDPVTHTLTSDGSGTGQVRLMFSGFDASKKYAITAVLSGDVADLAPYGTFFTSDQRIDPTSGTFSAIVDGSPSLRFMSIADGTKASSVTIESASVRELPGNHATQDTTAAKPTYRTDGTLHWLEFDGDDDALVTNIPGITNATVAIAKSTGTEITYPVDLSSGEFVMDETNYGVIVREGEFTEQEALDVTNYLNAKAGIES